MLRVRQLARVSQALLDEAIQGVSVCMKEGDQTVRKAALHALPGLVPEGHPSIAEGIVLGIRDSYTETQKLAISMIRYA